MTKKKRSGDTANRFVDAAIKLIAEQEGSHSVNLRMIAKEVGCAHTNVYNYFSGFDDLLWSAMERVLGVFGDYLNRDLSDSLSPRAYLTQLMANYVAFAKEQPGFFRFISTDPLASRDIPESIMNPIEAMLNYFTQVFEQLSDGKLDDSKAEETRNIVLAYLDGELLNMINGRSVPVGSEIANIHERAILNAVRLYELLAKSTDDIAWLKETKNNNEKPYPRLSLGQ